MLLIALAVAMEVAAAAWLTLLGLEPIDAGVAALTVPSFTGFTLVPFPAAPNVTILPPGIWLEPAAFNPAVAIVLIMFPLFVLVRTMSFVGAAEAAFVPLELPGLPAAVTVEIVLLAALTVVFTTELVLGVGTATVFTPSTVIFGLTLFKWPISLINFAVSLESCLHSALSWFKSLQATGFSTDFGSCFTRTWEGRCVEDTVHILTGLPELVTDFAVRGPFMWVCNLDGDAYKIVSGLVMVFPPLVVVIVVVTTLLMQALGTPLLEGDVELWLFKSDLDDKPFTTGSFTAPLLPAWTGVEVFVEFADSPLTDEVSMWFEIKLLLLDGWVRCLAIPHWRLITHFSH